MRQLTSVDAREVSLVTRAANRRKFALLKSAVSKKVKKGEAIMPRTLDLNDENIQAVLAEPLQGEEELLEKYAPNASEEVKAAMAASLRLLVAASEETGPEAVASIAKAAFTKNDDGEGDKEEEERKRKEAEARKHAKAKEQEEEERKRKAAEEEEERKRKAARAKNKAGKPFPGAKAPFGGDNEDDDEAEAKRKAEEVRKAEEATAAVGKIARLEAELKTERDLRLKKEAEVEASNAFKYIPVATARLADILRKDDEAPVTLAKADGKGTQTLCATLREILGACNAAI